jgi:hypothetical protein
VSARCEIASIEKRTRSGDTMDDARQVGAVVLVMLCGCSHSTGVTNTSTAATTVIATVPDSTATDAVTTPVLTADLKLPLPDPAVVAPTNAALADPATDLWLTNALTVTNITASDACAATPPVMKPGVAGNVVTLADVVLSELLINLDSALGGVAAACGAGDTATAATEFDDAQAAARAVTTRLEELGQ